MGALTNVLGVAITVALVIGGNIVGTAATQAAPTIPATTFGPDGSHYPSDTPDLRAISTSMHVVNVAASATAIRAALNALTPGQIDAGAVILVASGNIPNMTALNGYSNTRTEKVLITARDGFETVTGTSGWLFSNVRGIAVMRFTLATIDVKGATHCSFGWIKLTNNYFGTAPVGGVPVSDVEFIEMVEPESIVKSSDSSQVKAYSPESMTGVTIEGSYIAPSFYVDGTYNSTTNPKPHTDSLQIEGSAIAAPGVTIRDTAVFAANNSAMIIGGVANVAFDHVLIVAGGVQAKRYPFKAGGAGYASSKQAAGSLSAIQGTGGGNVTAVDSTFIGSLIPTWSSVQNTRTNQTKKVASSGAFTYDSSLTTWTASNIDAATPIPTPQLLATIWNVRSVAPVDPASASPTTGPEDPGTDVTVDTPPVVQPGDPGDPTIEPTADPTVEPTGDPTIEPTPAPSCVNDDAGTGAAPTPEVATPDNTATPTSTPTSSVATSSASVVATSSTPVATTTPSTSPAVGTNWTREIHSAKVDHAATVKHYTKLIKQAKKGVRSAKTPRQETKARKLLASLRAKSAHAERVWSVRYERLVSSRDRARAHAN